MKKIALISSFCDTDEKIYILTEILKKLKKLGLDTLVISPINLPSRIFELSDFVFFTKENPILTWPERFFTFWKTIPYQNTNLTLHRNVDEYGWAGLYQIKKMSEIALTYDYDVFYHLIYDLEIDDYVVETIKNDKVNLIHPRINPRDESDWWDATLHFMIFDRQKMQQIVDRIVLEDYLASNGVAEGQALKWSQELSISISKTPVRDKIFYWENHDFFNYSKNEKYKMFISKNENNTEIWTNSENGHIQKFLNSNLRLYVYDLKEPQKLKIDVDGLIIEYNIDENKIIELDTDSIKTKKLKIIDNDNEFDYTQVLQEIKRNLIYLEN